MKRQILTVLLLVCLFATSVALSFPSVSAITYNYYMNISGSNYQILNSAHSVIYYSTSSAAAFNWLLGPGGYASDSVNVYVESGSYSVGSTWTIYKNSVVVVFQAGGTLTAVANLNAAVIQVVSNNVVINGVSINGNAAQQTLTGFMQIDGIDIYGSSCVVTNSVIYNVRVLGLFAGGDYSGITNSLIYNVGWNGYQAYMADLAFCTNTEVYGCNGVGINSYSTNTVITGNYVHDMLGPVMGPPGGGLNGGFAWAIDCEHDDYSGPTGGTGSGNYLSISGNTLVNCPAGIRISSTGQGAIDYILISGNTLTNADSAGYYGAISLDDCSYSIVESNSITTATIGVNIGYNGAAPGSYCVSDTVYGNSFSGCSYDILDYGTSTSYSQPSTIAVSVTSSPTGIGFVKADGVYGYAGAYSSSPYIFYRTVGASVALVANTVSGYTFNWWSDSGSQSHSITVPNGYTVYTASYTTSGSPTPTPTATPMVTPTPVPTATPSPTVTPTPNPSLLPSATPHPFPSGPTPVPSGYPTATPLLPPAQTATNNVFNNVYIALGIVVVSTLIAGCYVIIVALNNQGENLRFGVGICMISLIELTVGIVIVSAFQNSMGTVGIIFNMFRWLT